MSAATSYLQSLLLNMRAAREKAGISAAELEERLILGPGWITSFEEGRTTPSIDMILAVLHEIGADLSDLFVGVQGHPEAAEVERFIFAEQLNQDLVINFRYAAYDASYVLSGATLDQFEDVVKTLRDGLSRLAGIADRQSGASATIKTDAVTKAFLRAVEIWPNANPSDLWWFIILRAYHDPYNHPSSFARMSFEQSWKRTGGWALEQILKQHYGPFLRTYGINLLIPGRNRKLDILSRVGIAERLEVDKIDVILTADPQDEFLGVIHVKASFAERRTDDVPMSRTLVQAGYLSPFWTMDCKSTPSSHPVNWGELGGVEGRRSAKRKDIEDEGYFTGCFSYNRNTVTSSTELPAERRIYVCDFRNPDDDFSRFIIKQRQQRLSN